MGSSETKYSDCPGYSLPLNHRAIRFSVTTLRVESSQSFELVTSSSVAPFFLPRVTTNQRITIPQSKRKSTSCRALRKSRDPPRQPPHGFLGLHRRSPQRTRPPPRNWLRSDKTKKSSHMRPANLGLISVHQRPLPLFYTELSRPCPHSSRSTPTASTAPTATST